MCCFQAFLCIYQMFFDCKALKKNIDFFFFSFNCCKWSWKVIGSIKIYRSTHTEKNLNFFEQNQGNMILQVRLSDAHVFQPCIVIYLAYVWHKSTCMGHLLWIKLHTQWQQSALPPARYLHPVMQYDEQIFNKLGTRLYVGDTQ